MGIELPPEAIAHLTRPDYLVWNENWPALETFAALATQWRTLPMGGVSGLDYAAVWAVLQMRATAEPGAMFDDLRLLERGALAGFRKQPLDDLLDG